MAIKKLPKTEKTSELSKVNSSNKEPQTMEELLSQTGYQIHGLKKDQQVVGTVIAITSKALFVDLGYKTEGILGDKEWDTVKDYIQTLKPGDKVTARVLSPENDAGYIVLSLKTEALNSGWKNLVEAKENEQEIQATVKESIKGGFLVLAFGIPGFLPISQLGGKLQDRPEDLVNKTIKVKVMEVDEAQNRLIVSEKAVSEKEKIDKIKLAIGKVKLEETYDGQITGVMPFGIFVKISIENNDVEGLVHISELSWDHTVNPENEYKVGDKLKVLVIGKDEKGVKLSLSVKQLMADPWKGLVKKYEVDSHVNGKVTRMIASGAFVELEPGIEGFVHISKVPVEKQIQVGDNLNCFIETVEPDKRRINLGLVLTEKPMGYK